MIGYLRGEILEHHDGKMIVLAGPEPGAGAVGYLLSVPQSAEYGSLQPAQLVSFHVYTHVREDSLDLYGFQTRSEKELFLTLLDVNGVGPKLALGLLSKVQPAQLIRAVIEGDKNALTEIPGIGKKTAERIVLELSDKFKKKMECGMFAGLDLAPQSQRGRAASKNESHWSSLGLGWVNDAKIALIGLGYREQDVTPLVNRVLFETENPPKKAEDLVKTALRQLL